MLRATIRADIAAAQRAAGDKAGAAENTRIVQQLLTDGKAKLEMCIRDRRRTPSPSTVPARSPPAT